MLAGGDDDDTSPFRLGSGEKENVNERLEVDLDLYITPIERPQLALLQSAKGTFGKEEEDEIIERIGPWPGPNPNVLSKKCN